MHKTILTLSAALLLTLSVQAAPPREESPAPRENLQSVGGGNSDEEIARTIAAAQAHPLGTLENPIRVGGPAGARAYLGRLRCVDGSAPRIGRESPGGVDAFGSLTTIFPLICGSAAAISLVFDLYHEEHVETRSPPGFRPAP